MTESVDKGFFSNHHLLDDTSSDEEQSITEKALHRPLDEESEEEHGVIHMPQPSTSSRRV
jgi:hypothetical protein